jgi:hypothetical protein
MLSFLAKKKTVLLWAQLALSSVALGALSWVITSSLKLLFLKSSQLDLYPWTHIFFHPVGGNLLNYMVACAVLGSCTLLVYLLRTENVLAFINRRADMLPFPVLAAALLLSGVLLLFLVSTSSLNGQFLASAVVTCMPILMSRKPWLPLAFFVRGRFPVWILPGVAAFFLLLVFYEQYQVVRGPAYLMNEYIDIYGDTKVDGGYVNNKDFLNRTGSNDMNALLDSLGLGYRLNTRSRAGESGPRPLTDEAIIRALRNSALSTTQQHGTLIDHAAGLNKAIRYRDKARPDVATSGEVKPVGLERLRQFYLANYLEVSHQNMARGQVNHFGHVLNPINEYSLGKPLRDIYMQYGLGNTFLIKWAMDLFGGISIQNYYKTYVYYTIYHLSYLLMLILVFRSTLYVVGSLASILSCFFAMGYIAYILAPGIIPSIRLFDATTLTCFALYLRGRRKAYIGLAILLSLLAMVINRQFGSVLFMALIGSTALSVLEDKRLKSRLWPLAGLSAVVIIGVLALKVSDYGALGAIFPYFWAGFFSWPAQPVVIGLTIIYLVISYGFLLVLRDRNFDFKYVYVFVFLYAQFTLLYYYWSGLVNHLPPILPFLVLQLFAMLYTIEKYLLEGRATLQKLTAILTGSAVVISLLVIFPAAAYYYVQKGEFFANFQNHRVHAWNFERATLISTIGTGLIKESKDLIQKYSPQEQPRIHIISKHDGLLPFVSARYSAFPMFDVSSYLFSKKEYDTLLAQLRTERPEYLFVDSDICQSDDPWAKLYSTTFFNAERESRIGRYTLLRQLFDDIRNDYEKADQGKLITVYRRKV